MSILRSAGLTEAAVDDWLDSIEDDMLVEASYIEALHPRDRNGRWARVVRAVAEGERLPHSVAESLSESDRQALARVLERADLGQERRLRKLRAAVREWSRPAEELASLDMHSALKMMLARYERERGLV
jgi:hypothetical protein